MAKMSYDERVMLLQDGRIDHLQFVMNGDEGDEFLQWCRMHHVEPLPETAELFIEMTEQFGEAHQ